MKTRQRRWGSGVGEVAGVINKMNGSFRIDVIKAGVNKPSKYINQSCTSGWMRGGKLCKWGPSWEWIRSQRAEGAAVNGFVFWITHYFCLRRRHLGDPVMQRRLSRDPPRWPQHEKFKPKAHLSRRIPSLWTPTLHPPWSPVHELMRSLTKEWERHPQISIVGKGRQ